MGNPRDQGVSHWRPPPRPHVGRCSSLQMTETLASSLGVLAEAAPINSAVGVYVHVPFCTRRCEYCSFNTAPIDDRDVVSRYLRALAREIELLGTAPWASGLTVETIFLGGGTPSLLEVDEMAAVIGALRGAFAVDADAE